MYQLLAFFLTVLFVLQDPGTILGIPIDAILTLLGPLVVLAATWTVGRIKTLPGKTIVFVVVPLISALVAGVQSLLEIEGIGFVFQLVLNLSATYLHQLKAQTKPENQ